ncbi:MAG: hypothetical protein IJZ29_02370 [Clostridia bacterium]|nr:hypothetical protein [Clostridia bacterium]
MNKIVALFKRISISNKNAFLSSIALLISCIIFVIPFLNALTLTNYIDICLTCAGVGTLIFCLIMFAQIMFSKLQNAVLDLPLKKFLIANNFLFSIELILFSCISLLLMLEPLLFLILGIIALITICGFNIMYDFAYFEGETISKLNLLKAIKIFHITIISITVCLWLIV